MAEWLKAHAWKACVRETVPWVRIPLSPPDSPKAVHSPGGGVNIAVWFLLYYWIHEQPTGNLRSTPGAEVMLFLSAAYVFGCAFRSFLPRADVQRICLFDTWLSSVVIGRTVATVAEICFAAQWVIVLHRLGTMTGADTSLNVAWVILPLIIIAECFSWYAVLTRNDLGNSIENSIWAVAFFIIGIGLCRLLPEFDGPGRMVLAIAVIGIAGYLAFLMTIDVRAFDAGACADEPEDRDVGDFLAAGGDAGCASRASSLRRTETDWMVASPSEFGLRTISGASVRIEKGSHQILWK